MFNFLSDNNQRLRPPLLVPALLRDSFVKSDEISSDWSSSRILFVEQEDDGGGGGAFACIQIRLRRR